MSVCALKQGHDVSPGTVCVRRLQGHRDSWGFLRVCRGMRPGENTGYLCVQMYQDKAFVLDLCVCVEGGGTETRRQSGTVCLWKGGGQGHGVSPGAMCVCVGWGVTALKLTPSTDFSIVVGATSEVILRSL